jgi:phospholipid/cholesterol/gamma-HCH transport system substrate-binding protein
MKYLRETDPRFQYLGLKVGSFLALLVLLVLLMTAVLAWRQDFFEPTDDFPAAPGRADGIFPGMDVTLHGIRVGRVSEVWLDEDGAPRMNLRIRRKGSMWLRRDAVAVLTGRGPLETPYINLRTGSADQPPLEDGAEIAVERESSIGEITLALQKELKPVIAAGARFIEDLSDPRGDVRQSLASVRTLTADLARDIPPTLADTHEVTRSARGLLEELTSSEGDLSKARRNLLSATEEIDRRLPELLERADQSLASMRRTAAQIEKSTTTSSPRIEELVKTSNEAAKKAETLLTDLRKIWMLRVLLPRQREAPTVQDAQPAD